MVRALLMVQFSFPALFLCALCVLFSLCWPDLKRYRNRPGNWVARVFMFRQLHNASCAPVCILLMATTAWNGVVSDSTDSERANAICTGLIQAIYFFGSLAVFFLFCFLFARLHTVGLFHPAQVQPSSQREGCILRNVDRGIFSQLCVYGLAPFACPLLPAGFDVIGHASICVPNLPLWLLLPFLAVHVLFLSVLVSGFSFQIYRLSKLPAIPQGAEGRRAFDCMLRRTVQAGVAELVGVLLLTLLLAFPATTYFASYYVFPLRYTLDSFMAYRCTTKCRKRTSEPEELASPEDLHLSEYSKVDMRPPPGIATVTLSTYASPSRNMVTTFISSSAKQNWIALKLKVFGLTRISEGSEHTRSTQPRVPALNSDERSINMSKGVLIIPPDQTTEGMQHAVQSLAAKEGLLKQGWRKAKSVAVFEANTRAELKRDLASQTAQSVSPARGINTQITYGIHQSSSAESVIPGDFVASVRAQPLGSEEKHRNQSQWWNLTPGPDVEPPCAHVEETDFLTQIQTISGRLRIEDLRMVEMPQVLQR
eukprot:g17339.t1